jgi:hypothetical protein
MNKNIKMQIISLSPLIILISLLPIFDFINKKLLFGIEMELLGLLLLKYRNELIEWNMRKIKEGYESRKKAYRFTTILVIMLCFGMGIFLLANYLSEVLGR